MMWWQLSAVPINIILQLISINQKAFLINETLMDVDDDEKCVIYFISHQESSVLKRVNYK